MASEAPLHLTVDPAWVHGDLQKLRARVEGHAATVRIRQLKEYQSSAAQRVMYLERSLPKRQRRLDEVTKEMQQLRARLDEDARRQEDGQRVAEGTRNQMFYHRGLSRSHFVPSSSPASVQAPLPAACPLSLSGFSLLDTCAAGAVPATETTSVTGFLKLCAPLFQWSEEERVVKAPFFFDEPCLMDSTAEEHLPSSSSAASPSEVEPAGQLRCRNVACAFWHVDQLAHVKMAARFCAAALQEGLIADEQLCCVRRLLTRLLRQVDLADSVSAVCAFVCEALQTLIGTGLSAWVAKRPAEPPALLPAPALLEPAAIFRMRAALLWRAEEQERWAEVTAAGAASAASSNAAALFQQHRDALSWRCLLATVADIGQRQWLARQGILLFPFCPQLHIEHVIACVRLNGDAAAVAEACESSCRTLSAQAAASVVSSLDGGQYGMMVARHVGYMVAVTVVHCAKTDAAAAQRFLAPLLSAEPDAAPAALLLPVARQNLTLMAVALRRAGHLRGVEHLPLAAISDHPLELASPDGANPADSGRDALYASLKLVGEFKRDGFSSDVSQACVGALQLSLLRTFSHRLAYMERVAEKTVPESVLAQAAMYGDYVLAVAQQQSVATAVQLADALAAADGATCLSTLLLASQLCLWGHAAQLHGEACVARFCAAAQLPVETLDSVDRLREAAATHAEVSAVEWVAAFALRRRCSAGSATAAAQDAPAEEGAVNGEWAALQLFPLEVLATDTVAAGLYFALLLRHCAATANARRFFATAHRCLAFFREVHLRSWSALDASYTWMVGLPHYFAVWMYRVVPLLLGPSAKDVQTWRSLVVAAAEKVGVLPPLLTSHVSAT